MVPRSLRGQQRWAVLISGRGSNLQALLDGSEENRIVLVVSSSARAPGLLKARRLGIPCMVMAKPADWDAIQIELQRRQVSRIFLAGFMRLLPETFVRAWQNRILNVHPSLLPDFPGLNAIAKSFAEKKDMGVTIHVVTPEMDAGPHLLKKRAVAKEKLTQDSTQESLTLEGAEFLISTLEQNLVREAFRRWN